MRELVSQVQPWEKSALTDEYVGLLCSVERLWTPEKSVRACKSRYVEKGTYFSHSICILCVHILDNTCNLTFKLQLASFLKIEARSINDRKQDSVET